MLPKQVKERSQGTKLVYLSRDVVSGACSEIMENILLKTYEEENPFRDQDFPGLIIMKSKAYDGPDSLSSIKTLSDENDNIREVCCASKAIPMLPPTQVTYVKQDLNHNFRDIFSNNRELMLPPLCKRSNSTKSVVEEPFEDYDGLDNMTISSEMIVAKPERKRRKLTYVTPEPMESLPAATSTAFLGRDVSVQSSIMSLMPNGFPPLEYDKPLLRDPQAQGDFAATYADSVTAISVSINFELYAKLLAFLLTINTLIFFKTVVLAAFWKFFDMYMHK